MLLALLFFIGAGGLLMMSLSDEGAAPTKKSVLRSSQYEDRVNSHLMMTNQRIEMQKEKAIIDNNKFTREYHEIQAAKPYQNDRNGVDLSVEAHAAEVAKELGRGSREERAPQTPDELIQAEIFNQQQYADYSQAYKEEYAKKFIENAARSGWRVKLNSEFKVISVTPIRNPSGQMNTSDTGGGSSQ